MRKNWLFHLVEPYRRWVPYFVLSGTLALTALATLYVKESARDKDQIRFQYLMQRSENSIESRLETYIAMLRGGAGLFSANGDVNRKQFQHYVDRLLLTELYPGVQGIGFTKRFSAAERNEINQFLQIEGLQTFTLRPDFARSEYFPIIYIEPLDRRNQAAVGYDMFTEPTRQAAMVRARDTGVAAASGKVTLVQEIDEQKQAGFLIYVPVYNGGQIPDTLEGRRYQLEGFIYSAFRADDLMEGIFGSEPDSLIDFQVYDGTQIDPQALLHQSQSSHPPDKPNYRPRFTATSTIDIAGRPWTITFTSRPTFDATSSIGLLPYVAIGGTVISLVLFGVTQAQMQAQMEAEQSAAELRQSEQNLQDAHDELENRVIERTAELAQSNLVLRDQMVARQQAQEALQQSLTFEALLKRITDRVRDSLDEQHILQRAVKELSEGLKVSACNTGLYNLNDSTSTICAEYTTSLPSVLHQTVRMADFPEGYQQLLAGQPLQVCLFNSGAQRGPTTVLAYPIVDDGGVLGDLWLFRSPEQGFDDLEMRVVEQVATQCAIALRQARLYDAAQAQVKALEKVNWLKDDFLSTVSHELRTPVSNMKLSIRMLDIALNQGEPLNGNRQKVERYLQILQGECQREIDLINDLLDLQRLMSGEKTLNLQTVNLETWLTQLTKPFQTRAQARQQTLYLHLPEPMPPLVADIGSLERVISELLNNACKYTPPGETITLQVHSYMGQVQFSLRNSGVEIPAHELPRIFDKFYRVPNADPWKQGGTGLGLALVQRLVEHIGGRIDVKSAWGETMFTVTVPNQAVLERA